VPDVEQFMVSEGRSNEHVVVELLSAPPPMNVVAVS
jgi:hypothetical protein